MTARSEAGEQAVTLPALAPVVFPESEPYWRAAAVGRLRLQRCVACDGVVWYPRAHCPECGATELTWFDASGEGRIYSYTVNRRPGGAFASHGPYVLAYVELDEGPRVLTNIVTADLDTVHVGCRVRAVFHAAGPESALVRFEPSG